MGQVPQENSRMSLYKDMIPEEMKVHFREAPGCAYLYPEQIGNDPITQFTPFDA